MLKKYVLIPVVIGLLTGGFAVLFTFMLEVITHYCLELVVVYIQPLPAGEGFRENFTQYPLRPYLLPVMVALGGLISGLITYKLSPESAGVGTDAAIRAYHHKERLSIRSSIVKLITSSITIGTGGTSGREGPIALIGAGVGSSVADIFKLSDRERRIALAVGLGAGVAAIFKAPLAGAIISAEVFFKKDFEIEAMIPSFVASVTSYSVFGMVFGFQPIFSAEIPKFSSLPVNHLFLYIGLGVLCALVVRVYVRTFHSISKGFKSSDLPPYIKPALGGFVAGVVGVITPMAIGNGYGWLQLIMDGKLTDIGLITLGAVGIVVGVSFTLGSGGSGGVFGPSVMLGGLVGAIYSLALSDLYDLSLHIPSFMIVGMVSLFAGAAKAPLSTLILIAEMTGGYDLLVPAMVSVFITYFLSGKESIFPSQVDTRLDSPAHVDEWGLFVLEKIRVNEFMKEPITIPPHLSVREAYEMMRKHMISGLPVVNSSMLVGMVTKGDVLEVAESDRDRKRVYEIMSRDLVVAVPQDTLADVFRIMASRGVGRLPVVEKRGSRRIVGIITRSDIGRAVRGRSA